MRKIRVFSAILACLALNLALMSCDDGGTTKTFTVTFNANGGSGTAPVQQKVRAGYSVTLTSEDGLTKTGCTFGGWNTHSSGTGTNYSAGSAYTPEGDIILYAKWTPVQPGPFTVTFDTNSGDGGADQMVETGGKAARPANPAWSGYTFDNWYSNTGLTTVYDFSTPVTGDITLYAKWTPVPPGSFTVMFYSNGGSDVATQTVNSGGTATRPANPTQGGYTFDDWYGNAGLTTVYNFSTPVTGNITLYAKWAPVPPGSFTVTFNCNEGSNVPDQTVVSGGKAARPANPTLSGYAFDNWYGDSGLTAAYNFSTPVTGNIIVYAKWNPIIYTVTFNSNGGSDVAAQTVNSGGKATRPANPTLSGYALDNWYSNYGLTTMYDFYTPVTGNISLYAKWNRNNGDVPAPIARTVSFNANGGNGTPPPPQTINDGFSLTLPGGDGLSRSGYTFGGWSDNAVGTGTVYQPGNSYTPSASITLPGDNGLTENNARFGGRSGRAAGTETPSAGITLYATWAAAAAITAYTVSFNANGGSGTLPLSQAVNDGFSLTLPGGDGLSRSGYTFGGWSDNAVGTGTVYQPGDSYTPDGKTTLFAKWNALPGSGVINVPFIGPTEKNISITKDIANNLSKSGGGSIVLTIKENFDRYEWFVGETKVASGESVTLQANNAVFKTGYNWITAVVYTDANAIPWSGEFAIYVAD